MHVQTSLSVFKNFAKEKNAIDLEIYRIPVEITIDAKICKRLIVTSYMKVQKDELQCHTTEMDIF